MKRRKQDLQRLARVTEAAFLAAQAELRSKAALETRIQTELSALADARSQVLGTLILSEERSAPQVLCQAAWLTHAGQRRAQLNMALARARAMSLRERQKAKRAFGRNNVAETLVKAAAAEPDPEDE